MLKVITAPTTAPITVSEAKLQAVIGHNADDDLLEIMISAVREHGEGITRRSFAPQTLEVVLDEFPAWEIELPNGPVTSITSVKYIDEDGVEQTLVSGTDYDEDTDSLIAKVQPVYQGEWPDTAVQPNAVRVRYEAGWTSSNVPDAIKQWMLVRVASLYAQRENHIVGFGAGIKVGFMGRDFSDSLLDRYTVVTGL